MIDKTVPLVVAWGGGVNSTAMLIGMFHRKIRPDLILFADTGGEKPETYAYRDEFQAWLAKAGFPPIVTVQNDGMHKTLERNCLTNKMLPSIAYGYKTCSDKYKRRPQDKFCNTWGPAVQCWQTGKKVLKAIGYDAGEPQRGDMKEDEAYTYWHPLIEWGWERYQCIEAVEKEGLAVPIKSACFFCPSSKKKEVSWLAKNHPELFERAVAIERNAELTHVKGLGRNYSWREMVSLPLFEQEGLREAPEIPCMCFDGDED